MILHENDGLKVIYHDSGIVEVWKDGVLLREHFPIKAQIYTRPVQTSIIFYDSVDWIPKRVEVRIADGKVYVKGRSRGGIGVALRYKKTGRKEFAIRKELKKAGVELPVGTLYLQLEKKDGDLFVFAPVL